jgi:CO/xanthine dehydrogenase FAD-binding subunit
MLYSKPTRLEDAVAALTRGAKALAGGTDLLLHLGREMPWPEVIVDLKALPELRELKRSDRGLVIGAGLPLSELLTGGALADYPALRRACELFAARQIRERATIGGNLMNASPAADTLPPLISY